MRAPTPVEETPDINQVDELAPANPVFDQDAGWQEDPLPLPKTKEAK